MSWSIRGSRPQRNLIAAVLGGGWGALKAIANGENPVPYALTNAIASASAMNEHRIADRAKANERNESVADTIASAASKVIDAASKPKLPPK